MELYALEHTQPQVPAPCVAAAGAAQKPKWVTRISVILMHVIPRAVGLACPWDTSECLTVHLDPLLQHCRLED